MAYFVEESGTIVLEQAEYDAMGQNQFLLQEAMDDLFRRVNGSVLGDLNLFGDDRIALDTIKEATTIIRQLTGTNPLFKRGDQLRHDYTFSLGVEIHTEGKVEACLSKPYNSNSVMTTQARKAMMHDRFCSGNSFTLYNKKKDEIYAVDIMQISNTVVDENDPWRVRYIQRSWEVYDSQGLFVETRKRWYPTYEEVQGGERIRSSIKGVRVSKDEVMLFKAYNRSRGQTWGVPDAYAAIQWVMSYSGYLKDNTSLVKSYSRIALKVSTASNAGSANTGSEIATSRMIGQTAVTPTGTDVTAMAPQGSNVNFSNGRPVAAMVAAALGLSIVALLSDPGTGGSYNAAENLDHPTLLMALSLQDDAKDFYTDLFALIENLSVSRVKSDEENISGEGSYIKFPSPEKDAPYRSVQAILQAFSQGIYTQKEARLALAVLQDVELLQEDMPEAAWYNIGGEPSDVEDPIPSQGNSGSVGTGIGSNNDAEKNGEYE